jgi:multiple sugar transport system permease protein
MGIAVSCTKWSHRLRQRLGDPMGYVFIAPAIGLLTVFFFYPMVQALYMSFFEWPLLGEREFVFLGNYIEMLHDDSVWNAWRFTAYWVLVITPPIFIVAFTLALLTKSRRRGISVFRSIYFVPTVLSFVAASVIWKWFYGPQESGVANYFLMSLGLIRQPIGWLGQVPISIFAVAVMGTWMWSGLTMLLCLGGLQAIPEELYEAAAIDGAGRLKTMWYITLPLLRSTFALALIISLIGSFMSFPEFLIMTGGGPRHQTTPILMRIYDNSFRYYRLGYGSALSFVLTLVMAVLTWLQLRWVHRPTEY